MGFAALYPSYVVGDYRESTEPMTKMVWDNDRIAALALPAINTLRANALRIGEKAVVELCDAELARRVPKNTPTSMAKKPAASKKKGRYVVGFHFVCDNDKACLKILMGRFGAERGLLTSNMLIAACQSERMWLCTRQNPSRHIGKAPSRHGARLSARGNMESNL